ncbi:hypothetical protein L6452_36314 [Arctium lappa]|uniref:Uncharacterized protein n=1 Tax=Arctium lappa TaxID=4217 RepID=A0ACB8Y888_ARCLA|nr:hypothetical protein L6452_36314 [Arctium lappa]
MSANIAGKGKDIPMNEGSDRALNRAPHQDNMKVPKSDAGKGNVVVQAKKNQRLSEYVIGHSSSTQMVKETSNETGEKDGIEENKQG